MRTNWGLTAAVGGLAMLGGFIAGCQTYDFQPLEASGQAIERKTRSVSGKVAPPNLMILLDKSDSMDRPENPDLPACQTGDAARPICGTGGAVRCDESVCPTRLSALRDAMAEFLHVSDGTFPFRVGLAAYPEQGQCSPSETQFVGLPLNDEPGTMAAQATTVDGWIDTLYADDGIDLNFGDKETAGGTPTAKSLTYLYNSVTELRDVAGDRDNFVLLLTDGLPNCNAQHSLDPQECRCALADPTQCFPSAANPNGSPEGCLDDRNTVAAIQQLKEAKVTTIVVGLGSETASGLGPETLNAMGEAGGFARTCTTDADCGEGDTCNTSTQLCNSAFYQASNGAALGEALRAIAGKLPTGDPCGLTFATVPSEDELIFVKVNGEIVPATEGSTVNWTFDAPSKRFEFQGAVCDLILASTQSNPVEVDVSVVQVR